MFDVLPKAGISVAEFAGIVGVTRIAVHNWVAGRKSPHKLVRQKVEIALRVIEKLLEMQKLPLAEGMDAETRRAKVDKIKEIVNRTLNAQG